MRLVWDRAGWEDYVHWQTADRRILKRINVLLDASMRDPFSGIGKPEQLRYGAPGAWSRRITDEHRLVYIVDGEDLIVLQARYHYCPHGVDPWRPASDARADPPVRLGRSPHRRSRQVVHRRSRRGRGRAAS